MIGHKKYIRGGPTAKTPTDPETILVPLVGGEQTTYCFNHSTISITPNKIYIHNAYNMQISLLGL